MADKKQPSKKKNKAPKDNSKREEYAAEINFAEPKGTNAQKQNQQAK